MASKRMRRRQAESHQHLYSLAPAERSDFGWPLCVYCGDPADTVDHVPPITRVDDYRALGVVKESFLLVKACRPCNVLLGDSLQHDILERIDALKFRLKRKFRRIEHSMQWDEEELQELGRNLRTKVVAGAHRMEHAQRRIDYRGGYRAVLSMKDRGE